MPARRKSAPKAITPESQLAAAIKDHEIRLRDDPHAAFVGPHIIAAPVNQQGERLVGHPIVPADPQPVATAQDHHVYKHAECGTATRWDGIKSRPAEFFCAGCIRFYPADQFESVPGG